MDQLTDNEKQLLAREVAADKYDSECFGAEVARSAFVAGWDAAMEYVIKQRDAGCGFCWVCRNHHRLVAEECRAMDGVA